jgi:putative NADH-flavin reductase
MKVLLFGAGGRVGKVVLAELAARGHDVTAAFRAKPFPDGLPANVKPVVGDATDAASVATVAKGQDAVVSAVGPGVLKNAEVIETAAHALVEGLEKAGTKRLLIVGGAGTLEIRPGVMRLDDPSYPEQYRPQGVRQKVALEAFRASSLDWTYISPAVLFNPGERTGKYRIGGDAVLADASGKSAISFEDFAIALADEIETPRNVRRRVTYAY